MVFEYVPFTLTSLIYDRSEVDGRYTELTENEVLSIIYELLEGLKFMHDCQVAHRDVKGDNVLLGRDSAGVPHLKVSWPSSLES